MKPTPTQQDRERADVVLLDISRAAHLGRTLTFRLTLRSAEARLAIAQALAEARAEGEAAGYEAGVQAERWACWEVCRDRAATKRAHGASDLSDLGCAAEIAARGVQRATEPAEGEQRIRSGSCDSCDPSFGCFDGSAACAKKGTP